MKRSTPLGPTLRGIILIALAPAGCGGPVEESSGADLPRGLDATADRPTEAMAKPGPDPSAAAPDGPVGSVDQGAPAIDAAPEVQCVLPWCGPDCAPPCDPSAYDDGGTGPCAPHWMDGNGCGGGHVVFPCGLPDGAVVLNVIRSCAAICMGSHEFNGCEVPDEMVSPAADAAAGAEVVLCYHDCTGRRPRAPLREPLGDPASVGEALARAAYLEAASVYAFLELAEHLEAHRAPRRLVCRARRAAHDEVRHAEIIGSLAKSHGGTVERPRASRSNVPTLLSLALHNVREGCVRETWGAACAIVQSMRAVDPDLKAAMTLIARDEVAHAALSRDVADWLCARLTPQERRRVLEERDRAVVGLAKEVERPVPENLRVALGLPSSTEARDILRAMANDVWAVAA